MAPKVPMLVSILSVFLRILHWTCASPTLDRRAAPPFGQLIYTCTVPGVVAPAFDDGPWIYTDDMLTQSVSPKSHSIAGSVDVASRMEAANFKATWFVNGQNYDNIYNHNATIRRMVNLGHQIGSHTLVSSPCPHERGLKL